MSDERCTSVATVTWGYCYTSVTTSGYTYCLNNPLKFTDPKLRREVTSMSSTNDGVTDYSYNFLYEDNELVCILAPFGRVTPMILHQSQLNKSSIVTSLWTSFQ